MDGNWGARALRAWHWLTGPILMVADRAAEFRTIAQKLGPNRCRAALAAFGDPAARLDRDRCVMGRAYGGLGVLTTEAFAKHNGDRYRLLRQRFGLASWEVDLVTHTFDGWHPHYHGGHGLVDWLGGLAHGGVVRYYTLMWALRHEALHGTPLPPTERSRYLVGQSITIAASDSLGSATTVSAPDGVDLTSNWTTMEAAEDFVDRSARGDLTCVGL